MKTVVLSSYPRSGNTWLRFMLATALLGERPDSDALDAYIPDFHAGYDPEGPWRTLPMLFIKSHFVPKRLDEAVEKLCRQTDGLVDDNDIDIVHIIRNPFDCAISVGKYVRDGAGISSEELDILLDPNRILEKYQNWGFGNWMSNNVLWLAESKNRQRNISILRYEDMLTRPAHILRTLLGHYGLEARLPIEQVVDLCSATSLRQAEDREIATGTTGIFSRYQKEHPDQRFINTGSSGGYREALSAEQIQRGLECYGALMQAYGYQLADYAPALPTGSAAPNG